MQFPIVGSASLFGLYCALKYFDKDTVNFILSAYFGLMGCVAVTGVLSPVITNTLAGPFVRSKKIAREIVIPHKLPPIIGGESPWDFSFDVTITLADLLAFIISATVTGLYLYKKHWTMNNILGICFCLKGIESFSLGTYKIGAILLVGLFFYDIFWVFGRFIMSSSSSATRLMPQIHCIILFQTIYIQKEKKRKDKSQTYPTTPSHQHVHALPLLSFPNPLKKERM